MFEKKMIFTIIPWTQYNHNTRGFISGGGPSPYIKHDSSPAKNILPLGFEEKTYHHITLDQNFNFTTPKALKFKKLKTTLYRNY